LLLERHDRHFVGSKQAAGLAHAETVNRKQVETLNLVCQHEVGIDISNG
jgi:hypothetical protein